MPGSRGEAALGSLHVLQHLLEAHDGGGLEVAAMAEGRAQEALGEVLLRDGQLAELDALAVHGHELPVQPLVVGPREGGLRTLFVGQGGEEPGGGIGHVGPGVRGEKSRCQETGHEGPPRAGLHRPSLPVGPGASIKNSAKANRDVRGR